MRDVRWGGDLIDAGTQLERIRLALAVKYNPSPPPPTEPTTPEEPLPPTNP